MDKETNLQEEHPGLDRRQVQRIRDGAPCGPAEGDGVAVEAPLEIRLHGRPAAVLMRTPGGELEDRELVTGFLFCEGVIDAAREILAVERVEDAPQDGMGGTVWMCGWRRHRGAEALSVFFTAPRVAERAASDRLNRSR